jgi:hypothetical protein
MKFVRQNKPYGIVLHFVNLTAGFLLYFLFLHKEFILYYSGFLVAYFLLWPILKKMYLTSKVKLLQYFYCALFIIFVSYLAMFLTMTFIINVPGLHSNFIDSVFSNFLFSVGIVSLGIYVILWPVILVLGFVNYLFIKKQQQLVLKVS